MDPKNGPPKWTPKMDPQNGPPKWTSQNGPPKWTTKCSPNWTPKLDPQIGPPNWTPKLDPQIGPPKLDHPNWTPQMDPQNGSPQWTPKMDPHNGPHDTPRWNPRWNRQLFRTGFPSSGKTPRVWIGQARVESSPFGSIGSSSGRQALEGATLAPGTTATLNALRDPQKRPPRPRRNLRSAKKGAASGRSGMIWEHLRPLLESPRDTNLLFRVASLLARGEVPPLIIDVIRVGRLAALQKSNRGVWGIVVGEVIRRLVARTFAQQLGPAVEAGTSPFQFVLLTKSGCECVAHCIQVLCETDEQFTLTSVDGVSAFDNISRGAMMAGLERVDGGVSVLPFVHLFHGRPSTHLWEDDWHGAHCNQGESVDALALRCWTASCSCCHTGKIGSE